MSAIGTASYANSISALLSNSSSSSGTSSTDPTAADSSDPTTPTAPDSNTGGAGYGPATNVQLSDQVKAILAKATSDATVAQRLQSFVDSQRSGGGSDSSPSSSTSTTINVDEAFQQLSGNTNDVSDDIQQPVQVVKSFATGLKVDGYTISAMASDNDGSSRIIIFGTNGFNFLDEHFGRSDEFAGGQAAPGQSYSEVQSGNVEYITINQDGAAATSVQASSAAGTASASSTASQSSSVTIAVDFNTGQVSVTQAEALSLSTTAQVSQPSPSFSTVA